ncbi:MAG: winged helix-turn-helix domain-containing protein [Candidatus Saccharimonadaceae bacterium]|nr:winged helix-turn-helix domain-containing protein [Candidatus Saccharimonadaceae bacterium]
MKVKIGKCYIATLSKGESPIRIESTHEDGGWVARTLLTSRMTRIKTVEQIVRECEDAELEEYNNRSNERASRPNETPIAEETPVDIEPATEPVSEPIIETPGPNSTPEEPTEDIYEVLRRKPKKQMSLLEAAQRVLLEFGDELTAGDIVQAAIQKGYWQTEGKTPGNTLNAAITREIKAKGEESRFAKGSKGHFLAKQQ